MNWRKLLLANVAIVLRQIGEDSLATKITGLDVPEIDGGGVEIGTPLASQPGQYLLSLQQQTVKKPKRGEAIYLRLWWPE